MKRLMLFLLMVIGIQIFTFSQTSYPKKILWESDTVLAITKKQLITINRALNELDYTKKKITILERDMELSDSAFFYMNKMYLTSDSINKVQEKKLKTTENINSQLKDALEKQKVKNRNTILSVGIGGTLIGVLLGLILN